MRRIRADEIVRDLSIYPRCAVDRQHVESMVQVLDAGGTLPPVVICAETRKLVDGFHRHDALVQHFGSEVEIEVVEKSYASQREMWLDAIRYNAKHGRPLSVSDRQHCVLTCKRLGVDGQDAAAALGIKASALGGLTVSKATALRTPAAVPKRNPSVSGIRKKPSMISTLPSKPGTRCPTCGARLLDGAECVTCVLADPEKRSAAEAEQQRYETYVKPVVSDEGDDDSDSLPEGWQDRLAQLRRVKEGGDELSFHVNWLLGYIDEPSEDYDDGDADLLHRLLEKLAGFMNYSLGAAQ